MKSRQDETNADKFSAKKETLKKKLKLLEFVIVTLTFAVPLQLGCG